MQESTLTLPQYAHNYAHTFQTTPNSLPVVHRTPTHPHLDFYGNTCSLEQVWPCCWYALKNETTIVGVPFKTWTRKLAPTTDQESLDRKPLPRAAALIGPPRYTTYAVAHSTESPPPKKERKKRRCRKYMSGANFGNPFRAHN